MEFIRFYNCSYRVSIQNIPVKSHCAQALAGLVLTIFYVTLYPIYSKFETIRKTKKIIMKNEKQKRYNAKTETRMNFV